MFTVDSSRDIVGYSIWPWDKLYEPLVGCFHNGKLVGRAICDLGYQPVGLDGPLERSWFRMTLDGSIRRLLQQGDPAVVLMRLEDATPIPYVNQVTFQRSRPVRFEEFLSATSTVGRGGLTGFSKFLEAPLRHQVDVLFLDLVGRTADPDARVTLTERLNKGESILAPRRELFFSEEFDRREVQPSARIGRLMTSAMWKVLRGFSPLGERWTPLPEIQLADFDALSTSDFVSRLFSLCMGRVAEPPTQARLTELANDHSRRFVASILVRDAASTGAFFNLLD